jgi:hypothetical protein
MLNRLNIWIWLIVPVALLLVASLFIVRELSVAGHLGFPLDDAWIHLTFARNFSDGFGFCFNPGEPVAGSTGPLWTALLGLHLSLFGPSPGPVKALGLILLLASALMAARVARQLGANPAGSVAAATLLVVTPRMQWAALSGMELMPAILLSLAGFSAYLHWRDGGRWRWCAMAGLLFGLSGWARPEALVLAGGPGIDLLWRGFPDRRPAGRIRPAFLLLCAGFAVAAGPLFLFNYLLTGGQSILPSTFAAKTLGLSLFERAAGGGSLVGLFLAPFQTFWPTVKYILLPDNLILVFFLPFLFVRAAAARASRPLWAALLLLPFLRALLTGEAANFQQFGRYLAVITPLFLILGILAVGQAFAGRDRPVRDSGPPAAALIPLLGTALGAGGALGLFYLLKRSVFGMGHQWPQAGNQWYLPFLGQAEPRHVAVFVLLGLAAAFGIWTLRRRIGAAAALQGLLVLVLAVSVSLVEDWQVATEYAWNVRNIEQTQVRIGRWLARETPPEAVVATNDIGAIGFFSNRRVIDMVGLVTPGMLERLRRTRDREGAVLEYFRRDRPDFVVIFDDWYPGIARRTDLHQELLRVPIENNLTCGSPATREMTVYRWLARPPSLPPAPGL